ncbi:MAG: phosphatidate cytidylyltransferase [Devosia sp.]
MSRSGESSDGSRRRRPNWGDLGPRLISAIVLVPLTALALYFDGYLFALLVGAAFSGAYREWETMVTLKPLTPFGWVLLAFPVITALVFQLLGGPAALGITAVGALTALAGRGEAAAWRAAGIVYFGLVVLAVLSIRDSADPASGIFAGVFLGLVVWLTDTGAFFTGRQVGGEKLAPDISPAKTWSGALGGLALGTIVGTTFWHFFTASPLWIGVVLSAALSVLGQLGDLSESALKRRFRIKDSGDIIPGHGGLMDRLDSVTFGAFFLYIVGVAHLGAGGIAAGVLNW